MNAMDHVVDFGIFALKSVFAVGPALDAIKDNRPWTNNKPWSGPLGAYTVISSAALLAHFYQSRRFVVDGRANYPDIVKFSAATAWLAYCNIRYFTS